MLYCPESRPKCHFLRGCGTYTTGLRRLRKGKHEGVASVRHDCDTTGGGGGRVSVAGQAGVDSVGGGGRCCPEQSAGSGPSPGTGARRRRYPEG